MKRKYINNKMAEIIRVLHKTGGSMSAHEIKEFSGLSYNTVVKWLGELEDLEVVYDSGKDAAVTVRVTKIKQRKITDKLGRTRRTRGKTKRYKLNYGIIFKNGLVEN